VCGRRREEAAAPPPRRKRRFLGVPARRLTSARRRDEGDADLVATALREAHEEVAIEPADVRVLGMLDDHVTSTDFVVTPVVGWIPHPYAYRADPAEVALVVELPLSAFATPPSARTVRAGDRRRIVLPFEVAGHPVWGATAAMLRELAARLGAAT
jgi:8-oxo-dGTP pyrophosphatase MutT (NUDIX family)